MAVYSQNDIQNVIEKNDIFDIISQYVNLKKSGRGYKGLCPFHSEKTPSFYVDVDKQFYYCFGCQSGGNVINFIMAIENVNFVEAVKILAEKAGITLTESNEPDKKSVLYEINKEAAKFYYENLKSPIGTAAYNYLKNRGITDKTIIKFGLGYSPNSYNSLLNKLSSMGYDKKDILRAGLIIKKEKGEEYYDRYRNRVMYPIIDIRNRIIGFGARALDDIKPKYLNSPETEIFDKSSNLYALNYAKKSHSDHFIVVEGYMDAISLHQDGIDYAVASLGTALTTKQINLMYRYKKSIILSYDSDNAGQNATDRGINLLSNTDMDVKILVVPQGKDPDEYIRTVGAQEFIKAESQSVPIIQYRINKAMQGLDIKNPEDKSKFIKKAVSILSDIKDSIKRDAYLKYISDMTNTAEIIIKSQIDKNVNTIYQKNQQNKNIIGNNRHNINNDGNLKKPKIYPLEESVLSTLINNDFIRKNYINDIEEDIFQDKITHELFIYLRDNSSNNTNITIPAIIEKYRGTESETIINEIITKNIGFKNTDAEDIGVEDKSDLIINFKKDLEILRNRKYQIYMRDLTENLKNTDTLDDITKIQQEVLNIKKRLLSKNEIEGGRGHK